MSTPRPAYTSAPTGFAASIEHRATVDDFDTIRPCRYEWCTSHTTRPEPDDSLDADGWVWADDGDERARMHVHASPSGAFVLTVHECWRLATSEHVVADVDVEPSLDHCHGAADAQRIAIELSDLARIAQAVRLP